MTRPGSFGRSVALLSGGTLLGQGLLILSSPILTRLYLPAEFGVLSVFMSVVMILNTVSSLRYEVAIPIARGERQARSLLAVSLGLVAATSLIAAACVYLFSDLITTLLQYPLSRTLQWCLPLTLFGAGAYQALSYWAVRERSFGVVAQTKVSQGVVTVLVQCVLGVFHSGPAGLLIGDALGRASGVGVLGRMAFRGSTQMALARRRLLVAVIVRYRRFALFGAPAALLNIAALQMPALMLAPLYGAAAAGMFALAQRVVGLPSRLAGQAIAQVFLGEAAALAQSDPRRLKRLFEQALIRLAGGATIMGAVLLLGAPLLFDLVFGAEWRDAGVLARTLALPFALQFVTSPLSQTLAIVGRQDQQLMFDASRAALVVAVFATANFADYSVFTAVALYSLAMSVTYTVFLGVCWTAVVRASR